MRLMVVGFGGVGKTTFCGAATRAPSELGAYHASLTHCSTWDAAAVAAWARGMATQHAWAEAAASVLEAHRVTGAQLPSLLVRRAATDGGAAEAIAEGGASTAAAAAETWPSDTLEAMFAGTSLDARARRQLAIAVGSLLKKGYFSTVGVVKVEGTLPLPSLEDASLVRQCALVDFAGQMEYLVSHQLLLASIRTLCLLIQPAASFRDPSSRHHGSWRYWLQFLRALGERRTNSLLLAASQLDRVPAADAADADAALSAEFEALRSAHGLGGSPLRLDYRPSAIDSSMAEARRRLGEAADDVAKDWWVPSSYERLAGLVRSIGRQKAAERALPILMRSELQVCDLPPSPTATPCPCPHVFVHVDPCPTDPDSSPTIRPRSRRWRAATRAFAVCATTA